MAKSNPKDVTHIDDASTRQDPHPMRPFENFDHMLEHFFDRGWMRPLFKDSPVWDRFSMFEPRSPRIDMIDRDSEFLIRAEVPGIDRKDLDVSINDNTVTIKGHRETETKEEKGEYYRCEISRGSFARTLPLPSDVDPDKANAIFKDGILELTLPKLKEVRRRKIDIG